MNSVMRHSADYIDLEGVDLLNARRLPARLTAKQTCVLLNFQIYELLLLMRAGWLECLNSPKAGANCRKYFSSAYILKLAADPKWLGAATQAVGRAVHDKNNGKIDSFAAKVLPQKSFLSSHV